MKAFLWRVVYVVVCVFMFWLVLPPFLSVIGIDIPGNVMNLLRVCVGCIAILYVLFGPEPPSPW